MTIHFISDFSLAIAQLTADHFESPPHFLHNLGKLRVQDRLFGVYHYIRRCLQPLPLQARRLPQPPFDPVTFHRPTQYASYRKAYPRSACRRRQKEEGHMAGKMPLPLLVHALEVSMSQQAGRPWKS